jgi:hypothetical protein
MQKRKRAPVYETRVAYFFGGPLDGQSQHGDPDAPVCALAIEGPPPQRATNSRGGNRGADRDREPVGRAYQPR